MTPGHETEPARHARGGEPERWIDGGITAPEGFRAAAVACGIKKNGGLDLALVVSDRPASAAGLFTINRAAAAPVLISREHLAASGGSARAIVANSGCANACTGAAGMEAARLMAVETARAVQCDAEEVLVASTGVIGVTLDARTVATGIIAASAGLARDRHEAAARAIMTTDPWPKSCALEVGSRAGSFRVGGIAKGSGMIEPMMATMLAFVTTDAEVPPALLHRALSEVTGETFNAITVDGECSTNDCVFVLANGASGVALAEPQYALFVHALRRVCLELALGIVRGGEGATKLVTVRVTGAASRDDARRAAKAIGNSPLVKTAVHGGDPNWGRLVAVAGRSGAAFELARARVRIGTVELFAGGRPFDERAAEAALHLQQPDVSLAVDLGTDGPFEATVWTCDFSADYVRINAEYRT
jgi:glutamate N-acetyltransferase / amino-acid N-acetyltransferase